MKLNNVKNVIKNAIQHYKSLTPSFYQIVKIMKTNGCGYDGSVDHVAFRSFKSNGGINNISKVLLENGDYRERDEYEFPEKHLTARWYDPLNQELPTVFVSQINEEKLSESSQKILKSYIEQKSEIPRFDGVSQGSELWGSVLSMDYYDLVRESEYAAWTLAFGYTLNHLAIPVHKLDKYNTIKDYTQLLLDNNVELLGNGKIQISKDKKLLQGSTLADEIKVLHHWYDLIPVPGTFVEFIERKLVSKHQRREGFDVSNANNIFESTYLQDNTKL